MSAPGLQQAAALDVRRLHRRTQGRVLGGVAGGLADHLGVGVTAVRLTFVVLAAFDGAGVLAYALLWVFAPQDTSGPDTPADRARSRTALLALAALAVGGSMLQQAIGFGADLRLTLPLLVVLAGVVIVWRQADEDVRARWRQATGTHRLSGAARVAGGVALVLVGAGAILYGPADVDSTVGGLVAALVIAAGLALVSSPWWVRMARDLAAERNARIREQERAEVAAHVHDSVLHTLTLIQRHVDDPREVARLARAQERELRGWLYRPRADATVSAALERVVADVEDAHGVTIELVVVGDCPMDERLGALRDAAREALVNAAKYAGGSPVTAYVEVEPDQVTAFVRDRGPGFELAAVPPDRLGLRESVIGRMARNGGSAEVRAAAGAGTEIQLTMPRLQRSAP